jgi:PAS domain S-box-containing protein
MPPWLWSAALLLLSGFALIQWVWHRRRFSLWLGGAFMFSLLGAVGGVLGFRQIAMLGHLASLPLFAVETYRAILVDLGAYGLELQGMCEQALRQTQDMALMLEVSQATAASLDPAVVLARVSESVARAVNADWAYVLLPADDNPEEIVVAARYGWWGRRWMQDNLLNRQVSIQLSDYSLLGHALLRRRQVLANLPEDYDQFEQLHNLVARPQNGPTLIQPINLRERSLGAMLLGHVGGRGSFSEADAKLAQILTMQVATAIDNARLYRSVDEQSQWLGALLRTREQEATQSQSILESITDGVVVAGEAGQVLMVNAAAEQILGLPREQLMDQTIKRLYGELLMAGGRQIGKQAIFQWDGKMVMGSLAPANMPDGTLLGYVAVFRDVTRERQAEIAKSEFVAAISHELRTPITSIKGYVELLLSGAAGNVSPQQSHFLDVVGANTERMVSLVSNLIAVSEMEQGTIQIDPVPVDVAGIIRDAVLGVRSDLDERNLDLSMNLPPDLSPVKGDPRRLRQILDNLLTNAIRFTRPGGRITIWAAEAHMEDMDVSAQDYLVVSIRDTGVGIPPEEHGRIFEKYYQVENPLSMEAGGSGMGLAIVRSLVEAHGGRVWVESQVGEGSTFSLVLPTASGGVQIQSAPL